ncbi:MAG: PilN domain-containing protein [Desulfotignum sp.]|nr:PilN domain-containing protein [Desulfotignum sp.]MCF8112460.1 PilN domain-containing protein [Desulfotignum sp.]MCF8124835.1 PilN domain-containing protein [Desulfotignum sp.]
MIRINLLPFRLARKRENIRQQVSIFFLSIILVVTGLTWYTLGIKKAIDEKRVETERINSEIAVYKEKADRVTEIKKRLKILEDKLKIVESLKLKRDEQLLLLEDLQDRIVPEQMWIESVTADEISVTLTGIAFDNPTIADFMKRLETSDLFKEIDLKQTISKKFEGEVNLKAFELRCLKRSEIKGKKG